MSFFRQLTVACATCFWIILTAVPLLAADTAEDILFARLPETLATVDGVTFSRSDAQARTAGRTLPSHPLEFAAEIRAEIALFVQEQAMRKLLAGTKYEPSATLASTELRRTFAELQADPSLADGKLVRGFASEAELDRYIADYAADPFQQLRIASMLYIKNEVEKPIEIGDEEAEKFFREHQDQFYDKEVLQCTWYAPRTPEEEARVLELLTHSQGATILAPRAGEAESAGLLARPDVRKALANAVPGGCGAIAINGIRYVWQLNARKRMSAASFADLKEEIKNALLQLKVRRRTDMLLEQTMEMMNIAIDY